MPETNLQLSCSGKTFLLGEYYITQDGQALLLNTAPRFALEIRSNSNLNTWKTLGNSPAERFIADNKTIFKNCTWTFQDPYNNLGGLGASTAEFLLFYQAYSSLSQQSFDKQKLLDTYLHYAWNQVGTPPSAADLLAQMTGKVTYVNRDSLVVSAHEWPFAELEFHLIHTQQKLATHKHLASLETINTKGLGEIFTSALAAFKLKNAKKFCDAINNYHSELKSQSLSAQHSQELIKSFQAQCPILAAKGCGAMGSDIVLLLSEPSATAQIKKLCHDLNLIYIASTQNLTDGYHLEETVVS